jgi:hypothetical protein
MLLSTTYTPGSSSGSAEVTSATCTPFLSSTVSSVSESLLFFLFWLCFFFSSFLAFFFLCLLLSSFSVSSSEDFARAGALASAAEDAGERDEAAAAAAEASAGREEDEVPGGGQGAATGQDEAARGHDDAAEGHDDAAEGHDDAAEGHDKERRQRGTAARRARLWQAGLRPGGGVNLRFAARFRLGSSSFASLPSSERYECVWLCYGCGWVRVAFASCRVCVACIRTTNRASAFRTLVTHFARVLCHRVTSSSVTGHSRPKGNSNVNSLCA